MKSLFLYLGLFLASPVLASPSTPHHASSLTLDAQLVSAARSGNVASISSLIRKGANPNAQGGQPLLEAVYKSHPEAVRMLVRKGAKITFRSFKASLRLWGRPENRKTVVKVLLDSGANANAKGPWDNLDFQHGLATPLLICILSGKEEESDQLASELLKHGANANAPLPDGHTPLATAIRYDNYAVARVLIDHGVPFARFRDKLLSVAVDGDAALLATLRKHRAVPSKLSFRQFDFPTNIFAVRTILAAGGDPNEKMSHMDKDWTIFHYAVYGSEVESAQALLSAGAKVNSRFDYWRDRGQEEGFTNATAPFVAGMLMNDDVARIKMLKLLLSHGADPNAVEAHNGWSLLMWWSTCGLSEPQAVNLLLKAGAKTEMVDRQGQTALHLAALNDKVQSVKALLTVNHTTRFVNAPDNEGRTALQYAFVTDHYDSEQVPTNVRSKDLGVYLPTITALVKAGASLNVTSKEGDTLLHLAASSSQQTNTLKVAYLWQHGIRNVNTPNNKGETPLYTACDRGDVNLAAELLSAGSNPDIQAKNGLSPRQIVAQPVHTPRPTTVNGQKLDAQSQAYFEQIYSRSDEETNKHRQQILAMITKKTPEPAH